MKKIKRITKKIWITIALLLTGNVVFIGMLIIFSTKEQLAKTDLTGWLVTILLYWVFCGLIWFAKKTQSLFDAAIHIGLVQPFAKEFKE